MKRIPTLIGLGLLVVLISGVALVTSRLQNVTTFFSQAAPTEFLLSPTAANVTDSSFVVYWITSQDISGAVVYGKTIDVSEGSMVSDMSRTHFVSITNLKPGTKYYYKVTNDTAEPKVISTLASQAAPSVDPIYGKVLEIDGTPKVGAIVTLGEFAAITKSDGTYVLPVTKAVPGQNETITITADSGGATISCKSGKDNPLPTVQIGDNIDCLTQTVTENKTVGFKVSTESAAAVVSSGELLLLLEDRETVSTPLPTIAGKAGPNQVVNIVVNSDVPYSAAVKADASGNWSWTPPSNLNVGEHTVTITVTNTDGTTQTITRTFYVSDTSILPVTSGTPSAEIYHYVCVNQTCQKQTGAGSNSCEKDSDCVPKVVTHKACVNEACTTINGAGTDSCASNADCVPKVTTVITQPPSTGALQNTILVMTMGVGLLVLSLKLLL